jgi:hypothetical protein
MKSDGMDAYDVAAIARNAPPVNGISRTSCATYDPSFAAR